MKKNIYKLILLFVLVLNTLVAFSQSQIVRGKVLDADANFEIIGATVLLVGSDPLIGTTTDINGNFVLENVPFGRHSIQISYIGYKTVTIPNVVVLSGKESILNIQLQQSVEELQELVITATANDGKSINEMAVVSARTLNLEEAIRFAGSRLDVARMATNYAGVSGANDARNDIIVRGNSPSALLWRINGVPIQTTNHFSILGTTGGPVNALNTNLLSTSDFLTGAFPAEYGNVNAAIFDINFRNGNKYKYEFLGQIGFNGFEVMAEGPINKKNESSFLTSYRYTATQALKIGSSSIPFFQDISYNIDLGKSKIGQFKVFGMWGQSSIDFEGDNIDEDDLFANPNADSYAKNTINLTAISHLGRINDNSYFNTSIAFALNQADFDEFHFKRDGEGKRIEQTYFNAIYQRNLEERFTFTTNYNNKLNSRIFLKVGYLTEYYIPTYLTKARLGNNLPDEDNDGFPDYKTSVDQKEAFFLHQAYAQMEYKFTDDLALNTGLHGQYLDFSEKSAIEPRIGLSWQYHQTRRLSLAYGLHSQMTTAPILFAETKENGIQVQTNKNLEFYKSHHFVLGHDYNFAADWRLKVEAYYQYLYDVPVEGREKTSYSVLNEGADFRFDYRYHLVNEGTGTNKGFEITLEKFFSKGYYGLFTSSLFDSKYKGSDGIERNTGFNTNRIFNLLLGKEWRVGSQGQHAFTINTKLASSGPKPYTPINLEKSIVDGEEKKYDELAFSEHYNEYFRWDVKLGFTLNWRKISQQWFVDFQNVTDRNNEFVKRYNTVNNQINSVSQLGFYVDVLYRIQF